MLKGGIILTTALFSVLFLKRRLRSFHYFGIVITVLGITVVGASSFVKKGTGDETEENVSQKLLGIFLVLCSLVF